MIMQHLMRQLPSTPTDRLVIRTSTRCRCPTYGGKFFSFFSLSLRRDARYNLYKRVRVHSIFSRIAKYFHAFVDTVNGIVILHEYALVFNFFFFSIHCEIFSHVRRYSEWCSNFTRACTFILFELRNISTRFTVYY